MSIMAEATLLFVLSTTTGGFLAFLIAKLVVWRINHVRWRAEEAYWRLTGESLGVAELHMKLDHHRRDQ